MENRRSQACRWVLASIFPLVGMLALCAYLEFPPTFRHRFLLLLLTVLFANLGVKLWKTSSQRRRWLCMLMGLLFGLAQVCGERLAIVGTLARTPSDLMLLFGSALGLAPGLGGAFAQLLLGIEKVRTKAENGGKWKKRHVYWLSFALLMVCWLPYFLAFYPGLFTYDISYQYLQYTTGEFNTHHPLLHTLMVGGFCDLGRFLFGYPSKGILMYTVFQMTLMALIMASAIAWLYEKKVPVWLCAVLLGMDAVLPFNTLMVLSSTKDTLFSGAVLHLCLLMAQWVDDDRRLMQRSWVVRLVATEICVCLLRNNGFVCVAVVLLLGAAAQLRKHASGKKLVALAVCGLLGATAAQAGLKAAVNAEDGPIREAFSVPIQQLNRAYVMTEDEEKEAIKAYIPNAGTYYRSIADPVKDTFQATKEQIPDFLALWARVGIRHPITYIDAFCELTRGYYHLDEWPSGQYLETKFHESKEDWLLPHSLLPRLRGLMERLYSQNEELNIPVYSALLSTALWCWIFLATLWAALCMRDRNVLKVGAIVLALFLTILLGPCVMLRYIYPLMLTGPFLAGMLLIPRKKPL